MDIPEAGAQTTRVHLQAQISSSQSTPIQQGSLLIAPDITDLTWLDSCAKSWAISAVTCRNRNMRDEKCDKNTPRYLPDGGQDTHFSGPRAPYPKKY
jgi:hypothetical protein